jgi:hypothetical protein
MRASGFAMNPKSPEHMPKATNERQKQLLLQAIDD